MFRLMKNGQFQQRNLAIKFGMPQKSLAFHIGVSHQNVQKYEAGDIIPSAYRLKQIADFYKVKTDDLVDPTFIHRSTKSNEVLEDVTTKDPISNEIYLSFMDNLKRLRNWSKHSELAYMASRED